MNILVVLNHCYHLDRMVSAVVCYGAEVGCCGSWMDARGLSEETLVQGVRRLSLEPAIDWAVWADKAVAF